MNYKKKYSYLILFLVIAISAVLGYKSLNPSTPNYDDLSKVNVKNQVNHIENIAKEPHSIFDVEAKERVKNYLVKELESLGISPKLYKYNNIYVDRTDTNEDIENIYAEVKGKSDSYIMLVTHYDSSHAKKERYAEKDGSFGAADAGYALSTILETLRVIKEENVELKNGIKVLITDGEEYGLLGAKEAVKEEEVFKNVNYLVNIEARGTKGPAVMFETSPNNSSLVDLYSNSDSPFSYSITPEIYRLLPNATDFTVFLENKIPGINISVLDGLENYHTPNDNIDNISEKSLQHYGDQVLPVVKEFVNNDKYSNSDSLKSNNDAIFFVLGNGFIKYSKTINICLLAIIILGIIFLYKKFEIKKLSSTLKYTGLNTLFIFIAMFVTYILIRIVAIVNNRPFKLTYLPLMKHEYLIIIAVLAIVLISYIMFIRKVSNNFKERNEFVIGSLVLLLTLSILLTVLLPGGSYLTVFPTLLIVVFTIIKTMINNKYISYVMLVPIALILVLYVPTIYLFNCALTLGALSVNIMFVMIAYISLLSSSLLIDDICNPHLDTSEYTF